MLTRLALGGLFLGAASIAVAQEPFKENPISTGAWVYPSEKIAPATVSAFCASGFSVHFADGGFFSVLNQQVSRRRKKASVDTIGRCDFDAGKQLAHCTGQETDGRRKYKLDEEVRYERDGEFLKVSTSFVDRDTKERVTFVSYPMRCPDNVVHEILSKAIPAK